MPKTLGRVYPDDIQASINMIGTIVDELMGKSQALLYSSDIDIAPALSRINARLSNEVIIPSDELTDDEAREKLQPIYDDLFEVQATVNESFILPSQDSIAIPTTQANSLIENFRHANLTLYPDIVSRYAKIKDGLHGATALPGTGMELSTLLRDFDQKMLGLETSAPAAYRTFNELETEAQGAEETILIDQEGLTKLENWVSNVYAAEEALKRLEAVALKKPAVAVDYTYKTPWAVIAVGGLALLGLAAWAILE